MQHLQYHQRHMLFRNINLRTEKHGEDEEVAKADLDFEMTCTIDDVAALGKNTGVKSVGKRWTDLLYRPDKETDLAGDRMFSEHCIGSVHFERVFEGQKLQFDPGGPNFDDVKLSKFKVFFDEDMRTMRLRFQAAVDPGGHLDDLSGYLSSTTTITILPPEEGAMAQQMESAGGAAG